ncbi:PEP-CTERM sorting domain-containing protein [Methyloversatilis sp.]|uniref:PEP-CTERM sorting domain-containing protein n=1 Tax=Methyloversatilis sp. TaxID=2569862 RepID=UPI003F6E9144
MRDRTARSWRRAAPRPLLAWLLIASSSPVSALEIEFDYTYDTRGFFTDLASGAPRIDRRALLDLAASHYSGFTDTLSAIAPAEGDQWSVSFMHPSLGGPGVTLNNVVIEADTLRIYVGGSPSAPGVLGFAGTGVNLQATGSAAFVGAVMTRGQLDTTGPDASDYATWGGYIWFNASNDWYFGADAGGLSSGRPDFLTTATHEIGHVLGFGEADSWRAQIDATTGLFTGAASVAAYGGGVPVDRYGSHWAEGTHSVRDGQLQETMMDPSTPFGERQLPTALDYAGFADMGWQVSAVPEPASALMLLAGLALIGLWTRRAGVIRRDA